MSATPDQFLEFAVATYGEASATEFNYRNSASRAYYAAFHCCYAERARCPELKDDEITGSHDKLYKRFEALPVSPATTQLKQMAYVAKMMKSVRHQADYRLHQNFEPEDAKQQIADAKKVLNHWKQIQHLP